MPLVVSLSFLFCGTVWAELVLDISSAVGRICPVVGYPLVYSVFISSVFKFYHVSLENYPIPLDFPGF